MNLVGQHTTTSAIIQVRYDGLLAATAAAWGAGLNPALISRALATFATTPQITPGRFNVLDRHGIEIVLDYGHNVSALTALGQAVEALGAKRTVLALGLPGDRRDEDLQASVQVAGRIADEYVLYELRDRRGRAAGDVIQIMQQALPPLRPCRIADDQNQAFQQAWAMLSPGDRLVMIVDEVDEALHILETISDQQQDVGCELLMEREVD